MLNMTSFSCLHKFTKIRQVNLAKSGGKLGELTGEVYLSKMSWKNANLGISEVNHVVNFNLCLEQPALNGDTAITHIWILLKFLVCRSGC